MAKKEIGGGIASRKYLDINGKAEPYRTVRRQSRESRKRARESSSQHAVENMKITRIITLWLQTSFCLVRTLLLISGVLTITVSSHPSILSVSPRPRVPASLSSAEYLWYEAENMRGFSTSKQHEPILNPSWLNYPKVKAPGWGINGPGVSAEWSQGGESEWNSANASADESRATLYQDLEVPRAGQYKVWVRYADFAKRTENFTIRITQAQDTGTRGHGDTGNSLAASPRPGVSASTAFQHEFGANDVIDPHDEVSMYWGWAFAWDGAAAKLEVTE